MYNRLDVLNEGLGLRIAITTLYEADSYFIAVRLSRSLTRSLTCSLISRCVSMYRRQRHYQLAGWRRWNL